MRFTLILIVVASLINCTSKVPFNQSVWLDEQSVSNNHRLPMVDDIIDRHLILGISIDETMSILGTPNLTNTEIVLKSEIESVRAEVADVLADKSSLNTDERIKVLDNWFNQSTLVEDQLNYLLSWTNGAEAYPVYLKIIFLNNKLVSSEIFIQQ